MFSLQQPLTRVQVTVCNFLLQKLRLSLPPKVTVKGRPRVPTLPLCPLLWLTAAPCQVPWSSTHPSRDPGKQSWWHQLERHWEACQEQGSDHGHEDGARKALTPLSSFSRWERCSQKRRTQRPQGKPRPRF